MSTPPNTPPPSPDAVPWPPQHLARLLGLLIGPDQVVELRALDVTQNGRPHTEGGFFDGAHLREMSAAAIRITRRAKGVYFTLNPLRADLQARRCNRIDWAKEGDLAKDADVLSRRWLLVDVDPVRESGISASDEEKSHAWELILSIRQFLRDRQWPEPILCDSGNGYHLLYRIDLPADDGGLISKVLVALAHQFDTDRAKVDRAVHNAGRICKLPGTMARKGDSIPNRPHRWARFLELENWPEGKTPSITPASLLEQLVADLPTQPAALQSSSYSEFASIPFEAWTPSNSQAGAPQFELRLRVGDWLQDAGVAYRIKREPDSKGRTVYVLEHCPFNPVHQDPDSAIFQDPSGKTFARCLHDSCRGRGWQEFKDAIGAPKRHHYDPPLPPRRKKSSKKNRQPSTQTVAADMSMETLKPFTADESVVAIERDIGGADFAIIEVPQLGASEGGVTLASSAESTNANSLPTIQGNKRQLRDVSEDALKAIVDANNPPTVFQRCNSLTRIRFDPINGVPTLEPFSESALRGVMARVANWIHLREADGDIFDEAAPPPVDVVKDVLHLPEWKKLPIVDGVVECPVFASDGSLIQTNGFHVNARLWLHLSENLQIPEVAKQPSGDDVEHARCLLMDELLGDFPFADEASRATALAALLLPFVRPLIDGPTPLHLFDAPTEGTGKTLLATVISLVATGRDPEAVAEAKDDDEWRKRLTAFLAEGPTFVLLDNLNRTLDSGALASLLTSRTWRDRLLGHSRTIVVPNHSIWLASGNNTKLSREIIRRTTFCRLDAKVDNPWEGRKFRHSNLIAWTRENRGKLIWACLTLCQSWLSAGRPPGTKQLGMFEEWAATVGGILEHLNVTALLENAQQFREQSADQVNEWRAFTTAWWQEFGNRTVGVVDLFDLATSKHLLDAILGDKGERSQRSRLGRALTKAIDRIYGPLQLQHQASDKSGRQLFRLVSVHAVESQSA